MVVGGTDFVAYPAVSGARFAWLSWNHPDMPWDAAALHVGRLMPDGTVADSIVVAGGNGVSALQPEWTGTGRTHLPGRPARSLEPAAAAPGGARAPGRVTPLAIADADTGGPLWNLGLRWFLPLEDGRIVAVRTNGRDELVVLEPTGTRTLGIPLSGSLLLRDVRGTRVLLTGGGSRTPGGLWLLDVDDPASLVALRGGTGLDPDWLPRVAPRHVRGSVGRGARVRLSADQPGGDRAGG